MAKIEKQFTFNNHTCRFVKDVGKLAFYTYPDKNGDETNLLIVANDGSDTILAEVSADMHYGAYGDEFRGFNIKEV